MKTLLTLLTVLAGLALLAPPTRAADDCPAAGGLKFVCGIDKPEDLVSLPGGRWIVTSSMVPGGGLHLVDIRARTSEKWTAAPAAGTSETYRSCTAPPRPEEFLTQGLSLRDHGQGHQTLYVVNHGARSAIEVFDIDSRGAKPTLIWLGCVVMPAGLAANSVASASDGTIFATVMVHPGMTAADFLNDKRPTGAVYAWRPGSSGFLRVWGTELSGANGIEISPDDKEMYVVSSGFGTVTVFSNTNPAKVLHTIEMPGFLADNVHWVGDRLLTGGTKIDEPGCGGALKSVNGKVDNVCPRGYTVAAINSASQAVTVLASGAASPDYTFVTFGLPTGKVMWLGTTIGNRLAYRPFP